MTLVGHVRPGPIGDANVRVEASAVTARLVNVKTVRFLSPFRYPGGKTWLVPRVRQWLVTLPRPTATFVEPFAGGAIVSLSVLSERLVERVVMAEIDADVASVWLVLFGRSDADFDALCGEVLAFPMSRETATERLARPDATVVDRAFRTVLRNRVNRGGILAPGAKMLNAGEKKRGVASRWYPATLVGRMRHVRAMREMVEFVHGDAFDVVARHADDPSATFFVDPPYTAGGRKVGAGLYRHSLVDHDSLFAACAGVKGALMMTYDDVDEVVRLADAHGLDVGRIPMLTTHHVAKSELLVTNDAGTSDRGSALLAAE